MNKITLILLGIFLSTICQAQTPTPGITIGMRYSNQNLMYDGYLLYSPTGSDQTFLIDNCGSKVNEWEFGGSYNYTGTYLLEDASVIKYVYNNGPGLNISAFGDGCIEQRDWDDNLIWNYCGEDDYRGMHSDLHPLPNGNFLAVVQFEHPIAEVLALGINPSDIQGGGFVSEGCIEIMPTGLESGTIVWEWDIFDHMVQDYDSNVTSTYGIIEDRPERYDMGLNGGFLHFNSIDYNEDLDIIVFSSWQDDEIYMIDHSTSTEEAEGSIGGNFGMGGDLIYRWGRPGNYDTDGPQRLSGQHNPRFVEEGPWVGSMSVFNNGYGGLNGTSGSAACIFTPVLDTVNLTFAKNADGAFLPDNFDFAWNGDIWPGDDMSSGIESGVDFLGNGNFVVCEATSGRISEVTSLGEVVWIYQNPFSGGTLQDQGDNPNSDVYKVEKYSVDYTAFTGLALDAYGPVENQNTLTLNCSINPEDAPNNASLLSVLNSENFGCIPELEPQIQVSNYGIGDISSLEILVSINGAVIDTADWAGTIPFQGIEDIQLPLYTFTPSATNTVTIEIISVNGIADDAPADNTLVFDFLTSANSEVGDYLLEISTDNWGNETGVEIRNSLGWVVYQDQNWPDFFIDSVTVNIPIEDCYSISVFDSWGDGIDPPYGVRLFDPAGNLIIEVSENSFTQIDRNFFVGSVAAELAEANFTYLLNQAEVEFTDNSTNAVSWLWDFGDGTTSSEESPSYIYAETGTYSVCLSVTNIDGVEDQTCQKIIIESTDLQETNLLELILFPNPAETFITIETSIENYSYDIYDSLGQHILSGTKEGEQINIEALSPGIYLLEFADYFGNRTVRNFTKL